MTTAYDQLEEAILPDLTFRACWNRLVAQRVLRLCLECSRLEGIPVDEKNIPRRWLQNAKHNWQSVVYAKYKERYGLSVITLLILSALIKVAIDWLLEFWFTASKRPILQEALKQF